MLDKLKMQIMWDHFKDSYLEKRKKTVSRPCICSENDDDISNKGTLQDHL